MSEVGTGDSLSEELKRLLEQTDLAQLGEITPTLDPISPGDGIDRFLERKETEIRPVTVEEYRNKLGYFQQFCEIRNLDNLNELDGRFLDEYQRWRRKDSHNQSEPLSNKTMQDDMYLLQDFIGFLEEIEAVKENLSNKIRIPTLGETEGIRDIDIAANRVEKVLGYLHSYHYASREHVVWAFHAHTGRRPGGLYALDVCDVHLDGNDPYVDINHRPDETPLKNGKEGESEVGLSGEVPQIFRDYIAQQRIDVTTDSGRRPFLTSTQGRLSKSTMRRYFYKWSRPCAIGDSCPHDKTPETCGAAQSADDASGCESSRPPYALRHGYISQRLQEGLPAHVLSDRCDVSEEIIEKHYDERDETEKRELRQQVLEEFQEERDGGYL